MHVNPEIAQAGTPSVQQISSHKTRQRVLTVGESHIIVTTTSKMMMCMNRFGAITSLRSIANQTRRTFVVKVPVIRTAPTSNRVRQALPSSSAISTSLRYKSVAAVPEYDYDEVFAVKSKGHADAAAARTELDTRPDEAWRINLGRGNVNQWLTGPRSEDWFTGMLPSCCPGKFSDRLVSS